MLTIAALWMSAWWSVIGLLLAPMVPGHWLAVVAAALLSAAPLLYFARRTEGAYPSAWIRLLVFRPFLYIQLAIPLVASAGAAGFLLGAPFGVGLRAGQSGLLGLAAAFAVLAATGYVGSRRLRVQPLDAFVADLPPSFAGMRIAHVSDLHVGPHTSRRHLAAIARAVAEARSDLIAITGDQVDDYARDVEWFAAAFSGLSAPLGVFAVAGNHDVYAGWPGVRAGLEAMGITVLVNDAVKVTRDDDELWIAGTGDPAGIGRDYASGGDAAPNIGRTLARVPANAFTIALAHNPALWPHLADRGVHLTLSGHTHHGQFSIPRLDWSLASLFLEHAMGSYERDGALLYINPGTNYWGLPLRIGALPEVTVITLRSAADRRTAIVPRST
jgi:predicted MPP superfamily phosphohydrolase